MMHWDCYAKWEHRPRFARMYFEAERALSGHNPYWGVAHSDDQVVVTVSLGRGRRSRQNRRLGGCEISGNRQRFPYSAW